MRIESVEQNIQKRISDQGRVRYVVRYYDPQGRRRSKSFSKLVHARRFRRDVEGRVQRREWVDGSFASSPLHEYRERVRDVLYAGRAPSTVALNDGFWRKHVAPCDGAGRVRADCLGAQPLGQIGEDDVVRWIQGVVSDPAVTSPETVHRIFHSVGRVFAHAVKRRHLLASPMPKPKDAGIPPLRPGDRRTLEGEPRLRRLLTPAGVVALADAIDGRYRTMILAGAGTGLRPQELAALRRCHVDVDKGLVHVRDSRVKGEGGRFKIGPVKTQSSRRSVRISEDLLSALAEDFEDRRVGGDDLIWPGPGGGVLDGKNFRRRFLQPAVRESIGEPFTLYDLRHTHVATLIERGVHAVKIQKRMGHKSIQTTIDVYGDLFDWADDECADVLEGVFAS